MASPNERIYRKTEQGAAALKTRANSLSPQGRTALILVNGRETLAMLAAKIGPDAKVLVQHLEELGLVELVNGTPAVLRPGPPAVPAQAHSVPTAKSQAPPLQPPDRDAAAALQALKREVVMRLAPHFGPEAEVICRPLLLAQNAQASRDALLAIESKLSIYLGRKGAQRLLDGLRP